MNDVIYFWQISPSPHQNAFIKSLLENVRFNGNITMNFMYDININRINMGMNDVDYGCAKVNIHKDIHDMSKALDDSPKNSIHIISSYLVKREIYSILKKAAVNHKKIGIMSEGYDPRGIKGLLRKLRSTYYMSNYNDSVDFILALGSNAIRWYEYHGFKKNIIFPFCYVVPEDLIDSANSENEGYIDIIYVGNLTKNKQVGKLISAIDDIDSKVNLTIIGDGPERNSICRKVVALNLSSSVNIKGFLPYNETRRQISKADLLVLPSRWDGWGAVVNEALMSGVPVICSNYCGSSILIRKETNGEVFNYESTEELTQKINYVIKRKYSKQKIRDWSKSISPDSISNYFLDILDAVYNDGEIPCLPWGRH